jgi:CHAT domain-containing protein/tetratricopeptide (TPR) repeat protein
LKTQGPGTVAVALTLLHLSELYDARGDEKASDSVHLRALAALERAAEAKDPEAPVLLHHLAERYEEDGAPLRAEAMYLRSLIACDKVFGPESDFTALVLNNLGELYRKQRQGRKAEQFFLRALKMTEKLHGPEHQDIAFYLNNLSVLYKQQGDHARAEALYRRTLAMNEKKFGGRHPETLRSLHNLASLYVEQGAYAKAILIYEGFAQFLGENPSSVEEFFAPYVLTELAALYLSNDDAARAEPLFKRVFEIQQERGESMDTTGIVVHLTSVARVFIRNSHLDRAERVVRRALSLSEEAEYNHDVAMMLNWLTTIYRMQGKYDKAEQSIRRALSVHGAEEGDEPGDPDVTELFTEMAILRQARGETAEAIKALVYANDVRERNLRLMLFAGRSGLDGQGGMAGLEDETYITITLNVRSAPDDAEATRLALDTILRRKGRTLDFISNNMQRLRLSPDPAAATLLGASTKARSQYAATVLKGSGGAGHFQHLLQLSELERQLRRHDGEIRQILYASSSEGMANFFGSPYITLEAVQRNILRDAALVEIVQYDPLNFRYTTRNEMWEAPRYVAYVMHSEGKPAVVDLGEAAPINLAATALRAALRDPRSADVKARARALDEKVMKPLRPLLRGRQKVLLSPDGALNLIPFAALADEDGRYLVERYSFIYLTSGRDLSRARGRATGKHPPVIVADPDFGARAAPAQARGERSSGALSGAVFKPLLGTSEEARALKEIMPAAVVLSKGRATETAVKSLDGPSILHIATHGFFLEAATGEPVPSAGGPSVATPSRELKQGEPGGWARPGVENSLLRSGLGLAGANLPRAGEDDGLLTALEVAGMNLMDTQLVVLSACDTGVGEVLSGEGVYGLRRALVLAGAESQVISLWPVSDRGTKDFMIEYYRRLQAGEGRGEGLRQVQLHLLSSAERSHPFYWASFIHSGEWAPLAGLR